MCVCAQACVCVCVVCVCVCVCVWERERERESMCVSMLFPIHLCRQKRIAEMQAAQMKAKFGSLREITAQDYVDEVNKAGDSVWVVLHLYKSGYPLLVLVCVPWAMCLDSVMYIIPCDIV